MLTIKVERWQAVQEDGGKTTVDIALDDGEGMQYLLIFTVI